MPTAGGLVSYQFWPGPMITLGIIEEQPDHRHALVQYLGGQPEFDCVLGVGSPQAFVARLGKLLVPPTLVLFSLGARGSARLLELANLRRRLPQAAVLVLSEHLDADDVLAALRAGAMGYLEQSTPLSLLKNYLLQVAAGDAAISPQAARFLVRYFQPQPATPTPDLTRREQDILRGLSTGLSYQGIADQLCVSLDTVRSHVRQVYRKWSVNSRTELLAKLLKQG
jgi:DNA-binding NarL/FixJ family response regulator